jgi:solute carrier family 25 2-oxodicarboxylate transporter 21
MDSFLPGAAAGLVESLCVQPFDMLKTRFQLVSGNTKLTIVNYAAQVFREGGILRFYRGILVRPFH